MTAQSPSGPLLNRREWLRAHGFVIDPFSGDAFQAETDPLFKLPKVLSAFVDPPNYEEIRGQPDNLGCRFIFAPPGGGKSSLRRRIKYDFDTQLDSGSLKVLAVEYIEHDYPMEQIDARSHVVRIVNLIADALRKWFPSYDFQTPDEDTARVLLESMLRTCHDAGLDGVCVLVDNIDSQHTEGLEAAFQRIAALASRGLLNLEGMLFKFMLPAGLPEPARSYLPLDQYPYHVIRWDEGALKELLRQRLPACMEEEMRDPTITPLATLVSELLSDTIEAQLIEAGPMRNQPRAMLRLGHFLLEEHFNRGVNGRRASQELIEREALLKALDRLREHALLSARYPGLVQRMPPDEKLIGKIRDKIQQDEIEQALKLFEEVDPDAAIAMQARLRRTLRDRAYGIITHEQRNTELNDVIDQLLQLLKELSQK